MATKHHALLDAHKVRICFLEMQGATVLEITFLLLYFPVCVISTARALCSVPEKSLMPNIASGIIELAAIRELGSFGSKVLGCINL